MGLSLTGFLETAIRNGLHWLPFKPTDDEDDVIDEENDEEASSKEILYNSKQKEDKRMKIGIDVSENNGTVNWQAVKDAGVTFAIVRSSYGQNGRDANFAANVAGAHDVGLEVGAYHYGYALDADDAAYEAADCKGAIYGSGVFLEHHVFYYMEYADGYKSRQLFYFST